MSEQTTLINPKKVFSRIGFALCAVILISSFAQVAFIAAGFLITGSNAWYQNNSYYFWLLSFLPLYAVAIPLGLLILREAPADKPVESKLTFKELFIYLAMSFCLMYGGNIIGNAMASLLSGGTAENALLIYALDNNPLKIVVMVILAPLLEEYVCRKMVIDLTRKYGEKTAALFSGAVFALLHQNLFQFFYAFALGVLFGYIYLRTGRLRYTIILHAIINFMGSVIAPMVLKAMEPMTAMQATSNLDEAVTIVQESLPAIGLTVLYSMFLIAMAITGLVFLIMRWRKAVWKEAEYELEKGTAFKTAYLNAGMILYGLICIVSPYLPFSDLLHLLLLHLL